MIIEKNNYTTKYFEEIEQGEVFEYESELYLKTTEQIINYEIEYNCVCLKDGEMCVCALMTMLSTRLNVI